MICLDIYDDENQIYTPYNFLDFCGFECRYNELSERFDVNGFVNGTMTIASFEDEELAVAVTRSLLTLKAVAENKPQPEARFIDIDMIIEELEKIEDEEEDEDLIEDVEESKNYCKIQDKELFVLCIFLIGVGGMFGGVFL